MIQRVFWASVLCAIFVLLASLPARANTFTVTVTVDDDDFLPGNGVCETAPGNGVCTLRAAIMETNALAGEDAITLPAGTYVLTRTGNTTPAVDGDLDITGTLNIIGAGMGQSVINGNRSVIGQRVLEVDYTARLTLTGVTVRNGEGGIANNGRLALLSSEVTSNTLMSSSGGGILNGVAGTLYLADSIVSRNVVSGAGGGIYTVSCIPILCAFSGGNITLERTRVFSNTAFASGGGIANVAGFAHLFETHITSNTANLSGGGVFNGCTSQSGVAICGTVNATDSEISANNADDGGGILVHSVPQLSGVGRLRLERTTVAGNRAITDGGGIYQYVGQVYLINSTLSNNSAGRHGGGLFADGYCDVIGCDHPLFRSYNATIVSNMADSDQNNVGEGGGVKAWSLPDVVIRNTILANNINNDPDTICGSHCVIDEFHEQDCYGALGTDNYSLIEFPISDECTLTGYSSLPMIGVDPKLGALGKNGRLTRTHLPLPSSPVLNKGNPAGCFGESGALTTDQRGLPRPKAGRCDIGAVEGSDVPRAFVPSTRRESSDAW